MTLTWDNGEGLIFKRMISVDDKYMFTVADSVENKGGAPGDASGPTGWCSGAACRRSPAIRCCTRASSA